MLAEILWIFLSIFCYWFLFYVLGPLALILYQYTLGVRYFSSRHRLPLAGKWAVITGASSGIGKAYAEELAADGLNIFLISRTEERLKAVAHELASTYNVLTRYVVVDFTLAEQSINERLAREINSLSTIACLVNNVGMVNVDPQLFADGVDMVLDRVGDYIACNTVSTAVMTRIVLPRLVAQRSGAALINISSFAGDYPVPYISLYSATKAFVRHFTDSLALEMYESNKSAVMVQTVSPLFVFTNMCPRKGYFVISPRDCAQAALNMLGVSDHTAGHLRHALQTLFLSLLPPFFLRRSKRLAAERSRLRNLKKRI